VLRLSGDDLFEFSLEFGVFALYDIDILLFDKGIFDVPCYNAGLSLREGALGEFFYAGPSPRMD